MLYCITHGKAHYEGETDDVSTLGDNLPCRTEEWDAVVGEAQAGSQCEPVEVSRYLLTKGSLAYLDTVFSGLVPVKVLKVTDPMPRDEQPWPPMMATIEVTANRVGYSRGEQMTVRLPNHTVVHRAQVYRRSGIFRVNGTTSFLSDEGRTL